MKFQGSKMVQLSCYECSSKSKPFRVTLFEDDEFGYGYLIPKDFETVDLYLMEWNGWLIDGEAELHAYDAFGDETDLDKVKFAVIHALCPIHAKEYRKHSRENI